MAKPAETRCPGVLELIAEVEELDAEGKCWCQCVKDDVPKAKALSARGLCLGAAKVIKAARARCEANAKGVARTAGVEPVSAITLTPVKPMSLDEMMHGGAVKVTAEE